MKEKTRNNLLIFCVVVLLLAGIGSVLHFYRTKPDSERPLKVNILYRGGRSDAYNDMALTGAARAAKTFGDRVSIHEFQTMNDGSNQEFTVRLSAQSEAGLIVCVGYDYVDAVRKVAKEYPRSKYVVVDGYIPQLVPGDNVACVVFNEQEGAFLMGAAAAFSSRTGVVGFIGGAQGSFIRIFERGYTDGARYINPNIRVLSDYIGEGVSAFNNPEKAFQLSMAQYSSGADVIFHAAGSSGLGLIEAATSQRKLMIGVDSDQSLSARPDQRPYILTSMLKRVDNAVFTIIDRAVHGSLQGDYYRFGLKEGGIDYAENGYNASLVQPIKPKLDEVKKKINEGEIVLLKRVD